MRLFVVGRLILALVAFLVCGTVLTLSAGYMYLSPKLPPVETIRNFDLQVPLRVLGANGELIAEFGEKRRDPIRISDTPDLLIKALLAAEDDGFYQHGGVDVKGLIRASLELLRYREIRTGGSTITMQVAKNYFLTSERSFLRKFNEILLALQLEDELTKEEILELYINKIYLGHRAYGFQAAAKVYYAKPLQELNLPQFAMLAGLPKAPSLFNPVTNADRALERRNWILRRMARLGFISADDYTAAIASPTTAEWHGQLPDIEAPYVAEMARQFIVDRVGAEEAYTRGYVLHTTIRAENQSAANTALIAGLMDYDQRHGYRGPLAHIDLTELMLHAIAQKMQTSEDESQAAAEKMQQVTSVSTGELAQAKADDTANTIAADYLALLRAILKPYADIGPLTAVLVERVTEEAVYVANVKLDATIPFANMVWARRYIDADRVGEELAKPSDAVKAGDIVYIYSAVNAEGKADWHLGQVPIVQSALVSMDSNNGALLALAGGFDFQKSKYNRAIQGGRQPGSVFKPFIYTAALESGMTPATIINDAPVVFEDSALETTWRPTGAGTRFFGPTRLREALYRSLNLVSIRMVQTIGVETVIESAARFGLPRERMSRDLSLSLGSASFTPWEINRAYAILSNGGYRVEPWFVSRIVDRQGNPVYVADIQRICPESEMKDDSTLATPLTPVHEPDVARAVNEQPTRAADDDSALPQTGSASTVPLPDPVTICMPRVLEERVAWQMNSMMSDVVRRGTATSALALRRKDIAGKTGTTNEQFDAWFAGFNPDVVTTVWVGFDEPQTLGRGEYGGRAALPIWIDYMRVALRNLPEEQRPQPPGMVSVRINPETGEAARPGEANAIFETFRDEYQPQTVQRNVDHVNPVDGDDAPEESPFSIF